MRSLGIAFLCVSSAIAGCGSSGPEISVSGRTLQVTEQDYGLTDGYFCDNLARGEFMVVMTNFMLCDTLSPDGGAQSAFHSSDETNLRFAFPSTLTKVPPVNHFQVGHTDCATMSDPGTQAVAWFSHNDPSTGKYDVNAQADSGTVTVDSYDMASGEIKGSVDLKFGGDHVTADFDALSCKGVVPGVGK